ncbi:uncharacterized protein P174DRAFT_418844 [Aspergillus novofumigatus IBT 16806]|uniref:Ribosomal RNA methyltransferase FtsJ domain-containing protein n=1 Tax=Aspergillus novofumigatus (strain IBT 16806) TaxID=1392255 RepID=A0A2I1CB53_ASPN1|nr:uncharacterized protein P174DRAFT_418844 [Aspergillus novofumigatus IBT 16806]PKX94869.1 hypothetical protein P174DRAFT_418844 [Aspergillus novofumigatus IBT 16806]
MDIEFDLPDQHPDRPKFRRDRPFVDSRYDLIFCGGAVVKGHKREEYRSNCERQRLILAQLVFALNRLKTGGSFVLLLHRIESWETASMLYMISMFADIRVMKHPKHHGDTSSFYLVAQNVDVEGRSAIEALSYWKSLWKYFSFRDFREMNPPSTALLDQDIDAASSKLIDEFGDHFLKMALPVWQTQAKNLCDAPDAIYDAVPKDDQIFKIELLEIAPTPILA